MSEEMTPKEIAKCLNQIGVIKNIIADLRIKLHPVIKKPTTGEAKERPASSPLLEQLDIVTEKLMDLLGEIRI